MPHINFVLEGCIVYAFRYNLWKQDVDGSHKSHQKVRLLLNLYSGLNQMCD